MIHYEKDSRSMRFKIRLSKSHKEFLVMTLIVLFVSLCAVFQFNIEKFVFAAETDGISNVWSGEIAGSFAGGTGTEADPFLIETGEQLAKLASDVNGGETYSGKHFKLTSDIALNKESPINDDFSLKNTTILNGLRQWTPIGTSSRGFAGTFDGDNKKITNMYIDVDTTNGYIGLFAYAGGATFKNLGIENFYVGFSSSYVGGLLGYGNSVTIENCYSSGRLALVSGNPDYTGLLVGYLRGTNSIVNCHSSGYCKGYKYVGGIVGRAETDSNNDASITYCYNDATIDGDQFKGGIMGHGKAALSNCHNRGQIGETTNETRCGGIVAVLSSGGSIENCSNSGDVKGNYYAGGIVGYSWVDIKDCYNTGNILGKAGTSSQLGGIVGMEIGERTIENCYNTGTVSGYYAGGIVGSGSNNSASKGDTLTIYDCYNTGDITATNSVAGGIVAYRGVYESVLEIYNCYNRGNVTGATGAAGIVYNVNGTIQNCYNTGTVAVTGSGSVVLIGSVLSGSTPSFVNCYSLAQAGKALIDADDATSYTEINVITLTQSQLNGTTSVELTISGTKYTSIIDALNAGKFNAAHSNWGKFEGYNDNYPMLSNNTSNLSDTIYLSPVNGNDTNYGLTADTGVKTFDRAADLVKDGGTIYMTETAEMSSLNDNQYWNLVSKPNVIIKRAPGMTGVMISVGGGNFKVSNVTLDGGAVWTGEIDPVLGRGITNAGETTNYAIIEIRFGNITMENSTIQNNNKWLLRANSSSSTNSTFKNVTFKNGNDSGLFLQYGTVGLINCKIYGNYSSSLGGGITVNTSGAQITGCEIKNNKTASAGGGICFGRNGSVDTAVISNCIISQNSSAVISGGTGVHFSSVNEATIDQCTISDNKSEAAYNYADVWIGGSSDNPKGQYYLKNSNIGTIAGTYESIYLDGTMKVILDISRDINKVFIQNGFVGYKEDGTGSNVKFGTSGGVTIDNPLEVASKADGTAITAAQRAAFSAADNSARGYRLLRSSDKTKILMYPNSRYIVSIPDTYNLTSKEGNLDIKASLGYFIGNDKLKVTLENTEFKLLGATEGNPEVITYTLNGQSSIIFSGDGDKQATISYALGTVEPLYSDTYSQNLTFNFTYVDGEALSD